MTFNALNTRVLINDSIFNTLIDKTFNLGDFERFLKDFDDTYYINFVGDILEYFEKVGSIYDDYAVDLDFNCLDFIKTIGSGYDTDKLKSDYKDNKIHIVQWESYFNRASILDYQNHYFYTDKDNKVCVIQLKKMED